MNFFLDLNTITAIEFRNFIEFLTIKGIPTDASDADIMCIKLNGEIDLFTLGMEFNQWLYHNRNDMTINPDGDGSLYHRD
jgi:hypothetical protein